MERKTFIMNRSRIYTGYIILTSILFILFIISMIVGNYKQILPTDVYNVLIKSILKREVLVSDTVNAIVLNIRLPRTVCAVVIGSALAAAGCCYQESFRNDLASPDVLGVSSGACVGAALGIVQDASLGVIQLWAFSMGVMTVAAVYVLSYIFKGNKTVSLLISGMLLSGLMNSVLGLIKYIANQETQLPSIVYWTMGSISSIDLKQLQSIMIPVVICLILLFLLRWRLNYFNLSEDEALSMGINIKTLRVVVITLATILVACVVSIAGTVSWIGLVIPHLIKTIFGNNTRYSFPFSCLAGASFLLFIDILGRMISTSELPLSILTGIVGIIIFFFCITIRRMGKNGIGI